VILGKPGFLKIVEGMVIGNLGRREVVMKIDDGLICGEGMVEVPSRLISQQEVVVKKVRDHGREIDPMIILGCIP
jgi:hypothetical protein